VRFREFRKELRNLRKFAEGWRGVIYTGEWRGEKVAVKVAKRPEVAEALRKEGEILEKLRGIEGFPQLLLRGEDFVAYRFIEGTPLGKLSPSGVLDFERGSFSGRPSNLPQLLQLLRRRGYVSHEEAVSLGKRYTEGEREAVFREVLSKLK